MYVRFIAFLVWLVIIVELLKDSQNLKTYDYSVREEC
jgi:hypothetical protein